MKLEVIKQEVYKLTHTSTTQQFRRECPIYTKGQDLRYKVNWAKILNKLIEESNSFDIILMPIDDIQTWLDGITQSDANQEARHRQIYYAMGSLLGWSVDECDTRWACIQTIAKLKADNDTEIVLEVL